MQGKVAPNPNSHANLNVAFHGLGIVQGQHHVGRQPTALESLLHPLAQQALRGWQDQRPGGDVLEFDGKTVQQLVSGRSQQDSVVRKELFELQRRIVGRG